MPEPDNGEHRHGKLTRAVVTGIIAGVSRAVTEWVLHHLPHIW
jgi:hypothetical protein